MTERDPATIWIEDFDPPHVTLQWSCFPWQNATRIRRKAQAMARLYARGWHCLHCGRLMPESKRIDATYCRESCRKIAARHRRQGLNKETRNNGH